MQVASGIPAEEILAEAQACGADLIVMGTHGRRGVAHLLFGSVAEAAVQRAAVPVMTVRLVQAPARSAEPAAGVWPQARIRRVMPPCGRPPSRPLWAVVRCTPVTCPGCTPRSGTRILKTLRR